MKRPTVAGMKKLQEDLGLEIKHTINLTGELEKARSDKEYYRDKLQAQSLESNSMIDKVINLEEENAELSIKLSRYEGVIQSLQGLLNNFVVI